MRGELDVEADTDPRVYVICTLGGTQRKIKKTFSYGRHGKLVLRKAFDADLPIRRHEHENRQYLISRGGPTFGHQQSGAIS